MEGLVVKSQRSTIQYCCFGDSVIVASSSEECGDYIGFCVEELLLKPIYISTYSYSRFRGYLMTTRLLTGWLGAAPDFRSN
jgi:hypothetical protein